MASIAAARLAHRRTPGQLVLLDQPVFKLARVMSAGIAGAALAPRGRERAGAAIVVLAVRR